MSLAYVHNFHQNTGRPVVPGLVGCPGALIRLSNSKLEIARGFRHSSALTTVASTTFTNPEILFWEFKSPSNTDLTRRSPEWESGRSSVQLQGFRAIGWRFGISLDKITPVGDPNPYRGVGCIGQMSQTNVLISETSEPPPPPVVKSIQTLEQAPQWFMHEPLDGGLDAP